MLNVQSPAFKGLRKLCLGSFAICVAVALNEMKLFDSLGATNAQLAFGSGLAAGVSYALGGIHQMLWME